MKKKRYSEEQIIGILKKNEAGMPVEQLARKHDVAAGTIYRWRSQYGGMQGHQSGYNPSRYRSDCCL